jgi:hypothetical protein
MELYLSLWGGRAQGLWELIAEVPWSMGSIVSFV